LLGKSKKKRLTRKFLKKNMSPVLLEQNVDFGLQIARDYARSLGLDDQDVQPHVLTMTREIKDNASSYIFSPAKQDRVFTYDTPLLDNDAFLCFGHSFSAIKARVLANGIPLLANAIPYTYADPNIFTGAAGANELTTEQEAIDGFFGADLSLQTDKDTRYTDLNTGVFYAAPVTQVVTAGVKTVASRPRIDWRNLGGCIYKLIGGRTNKYTLTLKSENGQYRAAALTVAAGATGYKNYVQIALVGYKINNGASKQGIGDQVRML
jgi:hypothetical protein